MTHFLTTPKFDLLLYIGEKCAKNPYFYHFFWKKEVKLEKNQKKAVAGINCGPWPIFPNITHLTHFYIWGVKCSGHFFFFTFSGKNRSNNKIFGKKNLWASTRSHDPFSDNSKIWPTFIYRGEMPAHTFAKLPVRALINDPQKNWYRHQQPMTHFFTNHKPQIWPTFIYLYHQFFKLSCACSNSWPTKKNLRASTRTHDPFSDNSKIWPTFIYRGEVPVHTFAKLPVHALINDPKKLFQKKVYVTIPQWFETFPNMSDLRSGRNRAKCGLVLNDPIDWFKLRLNQPKNLRASTRTHDPFSDNSKIWPTFIYRGEVPADTFAKLPVCALINDPKNCSKKNSVVTIPQWFETFPNMSDLRSGWNRVKCGLVLNDPIDWFKLRLNQPKSRIERASAYLSKQTTCKTKYIHDF